MTVQEVIEWDNYRAIDLLKRIKREEIHERYIDRHKAFDMAIQALEEIEQYRALGTAEELKEAREKQVAKKPINNDGYYCPICNERVDDDGRGYEQPYCMECGQALKWGEEDD